MQKEIVLLKNDCRPTLVNTIQSYGAMPRNQENFAASVNPTDSTIVIVYDYESSGGNLDIGCMILYSNLTMEQSHFLINSGTSGKQKNARVAHFQNGEFLVVWTSDADKEIYGRVLSAQGAFETEEFKISDEGSYTYADVKIFDDGKAVVVWNGNDIYKGRFVYGDGSMGSVLTFRTSDIRSSERPTVVLLGDGDNFVSIAVNDDSKGIAGKYSKADGTLLHEYGTVVDSYQGFKSGDAVALSNDDFMLITRGYSYINTYFYQGGTNRNRTELQQYHKKASISKGRDNVLATTTIHKNNYYLKCSILSPYNNVVQSAFSVDSTHYCYSPNTVAEDDHFYLIWESDSNPYIAKYKFKHPENTGGLGAKSYSLNQDFSFNFDFSSPDDGDDLSFQVLREDGSPLPSWISHAGGGNKQISGHTPSTISSGCSSDQYNFKVSTSKSCMMSETVYFTITVSDDPVVNHHLLAHQQANVYQADWSYEFDGGAFTDPNGLDLDYIATLNDNSDLPDWILFDDQTRTFSSSMIPSQCDNTLNIKVKAMDQCSAVADNFFFEIINRQIVTNKALNDQPSIEVNTWFEYQFDEDTYTDPENDTITYTATLTNGNPLPGWLHLHPDNRTFNGHVDPEYCDQETISIKLIANDGCNDNDDNTFDITFQNVNPRANKALNDQPSIVVNKWLEYQFDQDCFVDPENVDFTYTATLTNGNPLPGWLHLHPDNRTFNGHVDPDYCDQETISIKLIANDGCNDNDISNTFDITFQNENPTVHSALENQSQNVNNNFEYQFDQDCFVDPENADFTYTATFANGTQLPDWLVLHSNNRTLTGIIPEDIHCNELMVIKIIANDGCTENNISNTFDLQSINDHPTINKNLIDQEFDTGHYSEYQFDHDCFVDPENIELKYSSSLFDDGIFPDWLKFHPDNKTFNGIPPSDNCDETLHIKVRAEDHCHFIENDFTIKVINRKPEYHDKLKLQRVETLRFFNYTFESDTFTNNDPNVNLNYAFSSNNPSMVDWLNFDSETRTFNGTPDENKCNSNIKITVTADDGCKQGGGNFFISISNKNPILNVNFENHLMSVNEIIQYTIPENSFTDPENQSISLDARLSDSDDRPWPSWLDFNQQTGTFYGNATSCGDPYDIYVVGSDNCALTASGSWRLTIFDEEPEINKPLVDKTFYVNSFNSYIFDNDTFSDPEGYALTYSARLVNGDPLPDWLEFDSKLRKFSGVAKGCSQVLSVELIAQDICTSTTSQVFQIQVINSPIFVYLGLKDVENDGNTFFDYTIDGLAFDDEDQEQDDYRYFVNEDEIPDWLEFRANEKRFIGNTPNEELEFEITILASDSCEEYQASDAFTVKINKVTVSDSKTETKLSSGAIAGFALFSIALVASLIAFVIYRNHLKKKYERLWDGKQEFFTQTMPNVEKKHHSAQNKEQDQPETMLNNDIELDGIGNGKTKQQQRSSTSSDSQDGNEIKSDFEVSDMSNESDLEETQTSTSNQSSLDYSETSSSNHED
ncbi:dystroglycan-related [Anaeramoeba flamelloides]|uniref:Dystroglycan-related n=1 Tax=Anaeramoeba flamelloides TaxID=1746091 RepID=A0AAV8AFB7_9EUKA|nr:dystroglycan-related [Anaeramoeba flamelloides]